MAEILCQDFFDDPTGVIPKRIKCTRAGCIADRWANFVYSMDLSPDAEDDELGNVYGAWTLWDIPATHVSQIEDEEGNDIIVVAVVNRLYYLDWERHRDEWDYNTFAPIQRMAKFGPIPSSMDDAGSFDAYRLDYLKRLREFAFNLRDIPTSPTSVYRFHVGEYQNELANRRAGLRVGRQHMRLQTNVKAQSFSVTVEHAANEPFRLEHWQASWHVLGPRIRESRVGTV